MTTFAPIPPKFKRWTVEECENLRDLGVLPGRYELIEGMIIDKMGSGGRHAKLTTILMAILSRLFSVDQIRVQHSIRILDALGRYNKPEPDIAITAEGAIAYDDNPLPKDILLVAEVSDSSLEYDMTTKANLYARVGIPEYWIVDAEGERLLVHREPSAEGYAAVTILLAGDTISPLSRPDSVLPVADLFPKVKEEKPL